MRKYADFFTVAEEYCSIMSKEEIDRTPERWLDFYPHAEFEEICKTLLTILARGDKSLWITGNYGTGKTNAVLVVQKLFMDEESRVNQWFDRYGNDAMLDASGIRKALFERRGENTLVIYDYNAAGLGAADGLLVRLEKGIISALKDNNLVAPTKGSADRILERVRREGQNFFNTRDSIQSELAILGPHIKTVEQLEYEFNSEASASRLLDEVVKVLRKDSIYLDIDVPTFRNWVREILRANNLARIVYIFDEFHPFIEANREQLKTFEDITESPAVNKFFLIPVTHMDIKAYLAEGSASAKKANDRFYFRQLQMPNDTAFRLAKHAMEDTSDAILHKEWQDAKDSLWDSVRMVADRFPDINRQRFYDILPIHPMSAFLLKHLSEQAKSNQRSFFEYLKGSADGREFQEFINAGGPEIANRQFLTADYLWHYFIERHDLGLNSEISEIGVFFKQLKDRLFQNRTDDDPELRVLKATLLFCLLGKLAPGGHERLKPTVENVELSFRGDGTIVDSSAIIGELEKKHCFSVTNGNISLFSTTSVNIEDIEKYRDKFYELLHEKIERAFEDHTKHIRGRGSNRFDIRVSDPSHTNLVNITNSVRDKYSQGINKDDGSICLWFAVAKNREEQLQLPQKIGNIQTQLRDHRILMFTFPELPFCHDNIGLWDEYIRHYAQYMTENDSGVKKNIRASLDEIENSWLSALKSPNTAVNIHKFENGAVEVTKANWNQLKDMLPAYSRGTLKYGVDSLGFQDLHFQNSHLQSYAEGGMTLASSSYGPVSQLISSLKSKGITNEEDWFEKNPDHSLTAIRDLFKKKIANTVGRGEQLSIRKVYIELKRAPYGLRYNGLSAFVLGFCLKDVLGENYQWTNGQMTQPLDTAALKEIIEAVVKDDGSNKLGSKEKFICRLSPEEKTFIKQSSDIFGFRHDENATVESTLNSIQTRVANISENVPLWILPDYIKETGDPDASIIGEFINNVCKAEGISSKAQTAERIKAVRGAGEILRQNPGIKEKIGHYFFKDNFLKAFAIYVNREKPELQILAESLGDVSHAYCNAILDRCRETAGWLWSEDDINDEIEEVIAGYEVIKLAGPLCGFQEFVPWRDIFTALKNTVMETNRLPGELLTGEYPALANFFLSLKSGNSVNDLKNSLQQNLDLIKKLFFDTGKAESLRILQTRLNAKIEDSDLLKILDSMNTSFDTSENAFLENIQTRIENFIKESTQHKISVEWYRISGERSPAAWSVKKSLPARYIFSGCHQAEELIDAIEHPDKFAASTLAEILTYLMNFEPLPIQECQRAFLADLLPAKYASFGLVPLLDYLRSKYGSQPNDWPIRPDIDDFIKRQYKTAIAPVIHEKLNRLSTEDVRTELSRLVDEIPEAGMYFLEK